jgi:hypothetical protein
MISLCFLSAGFMESYSVAQLVEALRYNPEGGGLDSRWAGA